MTERPDIPSRLGRPGLETTLTDRGRTLSREFAGNPEILTRPFARPLDGDVVVVRVRLPTLRRLQLVQCLEVESVRTQEADPLPVRRVVLDPGPIGPFDAIEPVELRTQEPLFDGADVRRAERGERTAAPRERARVRPAPTRQVGRSRPVSQPRARRGLDPGLRS